MLGSLEPERRVGEVLAEKYRLEELLGSGGMGDVYRATNELVGRPVAIKVLRGEHAANPAIVERFLREARAANLVRHPNVVDVVDIGKHLDGTPFIVQELLQGEDLARYVQHRGGVLGLEEVVDLLCPVIDALAEAHARGVVHRDVKPENVFLVRAPGRRIPKLLDFGISKLRATNIRATEAGVVMGTPAYMAPEQIQGAKDTDPRSDVWAIGVMLFEVLSGRLPFEDVDAPALFVKIATRDAPLLVDVNPEIPPNVSRIVERCLRRLPAERYPSAAELARDLRHVIEGTELEPTGKRSIPPGLADMVPDLGIPSAPLAPTVASERAIKIAPPQPSAPAEAAPVAPDLDVPPPRPTARREAPKQAAPGARPAGPAPQAAAAGPAASPAAPSSSRPIVPAAALPGVMIAPTPQASPRVAAPRPYEATPATDSNLDLTGLVALAVVGGVVIATLAGFMGFGHRPDGWPVAAALGATGGLVTLLHVGLALGAFGIGSAHCRKAYRQWCGDVAGGSAGAVVSAVIAGASLFATVELVSATF